MSKTKNILQYIRMEAFISDKFDHTVFQYCQIWTSCTVSCQATCTVHSCKWINTFLFKYRIILIPDLERQYLCLFLNLLSTTRGEMVRKHILSIHEIDWESDVKMI